MQKKKLIINSDMLDDYLTQNPLFLEESELNDEVSLMKALGYLIVEKDAFIMNSRFVMIREPYEERTIKGNSIVFHYKLFNKDVKNKELDEISFIKNLLIKYDFLNNEKDIKKENEYKNKIEINKSEEKEEEENPLSHIMHKDNPINKFINKDKVVEKKNKYEK